MGVESSKEEKERDEFGVGCTQQQLNDTFMNCGKMFTMVNKGGEAIGGHFACGPE